MNKKIRNLICNECLKRQDSYISNDMPDIFFVQESLLYYELFEGQDLIIPLYEIEIFFLNIFYELNYKSKVNLLNENDRVLFNKMLSASSFSNLIELLRNDIYMQKRSVESVRNFVMSDGLSKCLLLKSIDEKLADKLKNILPLYIEDQLFKYATKEDGFGLLKLLKESNANIKEIDFKSENLTYNPTELIELDPKIYKTDMILELDHLIVLTEFQSTIVKTIDEKRYRLYTALVDYAKRNNKPLILIVISTAEKTKIKQYKINKDCVFTIPIVSLKDFDGDKIINNIENKIKNNQKITRHEMLNLALAPFMSSKKPLDKQIEKTVKTLDEVRKSMKCSSDFVFGIELLIVEKFIKNERQHKKLTNILRDTMKIIDEWRQEDYENGKKEGKEEEKINTAKNMLKENYTIKQIATITQLNIESIKQIKAEFGK